MKLKGFTLIENIIAIVILSIIMLASVSGLLAASGIFMRGCDYNDAAYALSVSMEKNIKQLPAEIQAVTESSEITFGNDISVNGSFYTVYDDSAKIGYAYFTPQTENSK